MQISRKSVCANKKHTREEIKQIIELKKRRTRLMKWKELMRREKKESSTQINSFTPGDVEMNESNEAENLKNDQIRHLFMIWCPMNIRI